MIFDIKLGGNFTRKSCLVADGYKTDPPSNNTYSSVVSQHFLQILILYTSLNNLDILGCDVSKAYLYADCIWIEAGRGFRLDKGSVMIIAKALYGLKTSLEQAGKVNL